MLPLLFLLLMSIEKPRLPCFIPQTISAEKKNPCIPTIVIYQPLHHVDKLSPYLPIMALSSYVQLPLNTTSPPQLLPGCHGNPLSSILPVLSEYEKSGCIIITYPLDTLT